MHIAGTVAVSTAQRMLRIAILSLGMLSVGISGSPGLGTNTQFGTKAQATTLPKESALLREIDLKKFRQGICPDSQIGSTDRDIKPEGVTIPSLWWTRDQLVSKQVFHPKLIEGWLVCAAGVQDPTARVCKLSPQRPGRVDMVVNTQLWSVLDYLNRYEFLHRLGTAVSECGYNIYIFSSEAKLVGDYTCKFPDRPNACQLRTDLSGKSGLRRAPTDGLSY